MAFCPIVLRSTVVCIRAALLALSSFQFILMIYVEFNQSTLMIQQSDTNISDISKVLENEMNLLVKWVIDNIMSLND